MLNLPQIAIPASLSPEQHAAFEALRAHVMALEEFGRRQEVLVRELRNLLRKRPLTATLRERAKARILGARGSGVSEQLRKPGFGRHM